ncbi:PaaI family thioesterase [Siccirubricoccus sp. G192]|uniref:PaaI family thioesterase n=1 Tax=Siccirubricoccus sp. G192 TaxID=2849651 RepID=UPI001C2C204A|nr:PaaI family thioesterase [Siccirubricoccus sp. G192]MBV1798861.1 PaaI family thioesterase [Siccirubricoccus sp. G192]
MDGVRMAEAMREGRREALVPEGFVPRPVSGGFLRAAGPLWTRPGEDGSRFGLLVQEQHCNGMDMCHGGMLATLADVVLGIGGLERAGLSGFFTTISLNNDFLAPVPLGAWVEARVELLKLTRTMMFVQGVFTVAGKPVLRSSGVFRLPRQV